MILSYNNSLAGEWNTQYRLGAVVSLGVPVTRIGIVASAQWAYSYFSTNTEIRWHHNLRSYGPRVSSNEWQAKVAVLGGWGRDKAYSFLPYTYLPCYTQNDFDIGYSLNYYRDNIHTSQWTASIIARLDKILIVIENDIFVPWGMSDNYRTGSFQLLYADSMQMIEWRNTMYTGYTQCSTKKRIEATDSYPARWGYIDYSDCLYSSYSHGVSALLYHRRLAYNQNVGMGFGVDDERIRNFWQNKLIHDMYFIPPRWNKARNKHIPMVADDGTLYLYKDLQKLRKTKPYVYIGLNGESTY